MEIHKHQIWGKRDGLKGTANPREAACPPSFSSVLSLFAASLISVSAAFLEVEHFSFSTWTAASRSGSSKSSWLPKLNWEEDEAQWEERKRPSIQQERLFLQLILPAAGCPGTRWEWRSPGVRRRQTPPLPRLLPGWWGWHRRAAARFFFSCVSSCACGRRRAAACAATQAGEWITGGVCGETHVCDLPTKQNVKLDLKKKNVQGYSSSDTVSCSSQCVW